MGIVESARWGMRTTWRLWRGFEDDVDVGGRTRSENNGGFSPELSLREMDRRGLFRIWYTQGRIEWNGWMPRVRFWRAIGHHDATSEKTFGEQMAATGHLSLLLWPGIGTKLRDSFPVFDGFLYLCVPPTIRNLCKKLSPRWLQDVWKRRVGFDGHFLRPPILEDPRVRVGGGTKNVVDNSLQNHPTYLFPTTCPKHARPDDLYLLSFVCLTLTDGRSSYIRGRSPLIQGLFPFYHKHGISWCRCTKLLLIQFGSPTPSLPS